MCKFKVADVVKHLRTGGKYVIMMTPEDSLFIMGTQPAYLYGDKIGPRKWVRRQDEMEDGRFELVTGE